jgi:hypothetical protein
VSKGRPATKKSDVVTAQLSGDNLEESVPVMTVHAGAGPGAENGASISGLPTELNALDDDAKDKKKKRPPRQPVPEGINVGVYSDDEERLFLEGLDVFGRDWRRVSSKSVRA